MKKTKWIAFLLAACLSLSACGGKQNSPKKETPSVSGQTSNSVLKDGDYEVTAKGFHGEFPVTVKVAEGKISEISVGKHQETQDIGTKAIDAIPPAIVESQSLAVSAVSGATVTSTGLLQAVEEAVRQAGGDVEEWKSRPVSKKTAEPIHKTADVVVIGGGGAGLSAAISAAEKGASVLLVEKTSMLGGNTIRAGGPYNAVDPKRQALVEPASEQAMKNLYALTEKEAKSPEHQAYMDQLRKEIDAYQAGQKDHLFDSIALHILQTYDGGDYVGKLPFVEKLATDSYPTLEWLESIGVQFNDKTSTVAGGLWPRAHTPINAAGSDYIRAEHDRAEALKVEFLFNCRAQELVQSDGRVTGVKGTTAEGAPVEIKANRAVVIASGGFAANPEMRHKYDPKLALDLGTTNSPANVGDGIVMAQAIGAGVTGMEWIQCLPYGDPKTGALNGWMGGNGVEFYYQINQDGVRFMAEDGRRDTMNQALLAQKDQLSYVIADSTSIGPDGVHNIWGDVVDDLVANGTIYRADTIEELAKQIGVDPAVLANTHETFNRYVEAGEDAEFGRKLFGKKLDQPPYFASPRKPTVHHTMGGLTIDLDCRVLNTEGTVIPGLYAAGEVTGGIHGSNRLGGNALVDIHVFGRTAGTNAASEGVNEAK